MIRWFSLLTILALAAGCRSEANEAGSMVEAGSSIRPGGSIEAGSTTIEAGSSTFRPRGLPIPGARARLPQFREPPAAATWDPAEGIFPPRVLTLLALRKDLAAARRQLDELRNHQDPLSEQHRRACQALEGLVELSQEQTEKGKPYTTVTLEHGDDVFTKALPQLRRLDNLRKVIFRNSNNHEDDEPLENDLALLAELPDLRAVHFEYCKISPKGYEHLGELDRLTAITFKHCRMSDKDLCVLRELPALRSVHIHDPAVGKTTDAGMRHLEAVQNLESVVLHGLDISDEGIAFLQDRKHLRRLTILWSGSVTEEAVADVLNGRARSSLEVVELGLQEMTDALPQLTGVLPNLQRLSISQSQLTNRGIWAFGFASAPNLEELEIGWSVGDNRLTGECLKYLAKNDSLRVLRLETGAVASQYLRHIARLRNLRVLSLRNLVLDDMAVTYLSQLPRLEELSISHVALSRRGRRDLQYLSRLRAVYFVATSASDEELLALQGLPNLREVTHFGGVPSEQVQDRLAHLRFTIYD